MAGLISTLYVGLGTGLATAIIPGPINTLIIAETLRRGYRGGIGVALAPLVVDGLVMIPLALLLQTALTLRIVQIILGLGGSVFLFYLGYSTISAAYQQVEFNPSSERGEIKSTFLDSFRKSFITHLLSPFAYIFWVTVGSTMIREAIKMGGLVSAFLFPLSFWIGTLIVSGVIIVLSFKGRAVLNSITYRGALYLCGIILIAFGVYLALRVLI